MDEVEIARILKCWTAPDEKHCDELLQRCLSVFGQADFDELDDSVLEMLAAAGDIYIGNEMTDRFEYPDS